MDISLHRNNQSWLARMISLYNLDSSVYHHHHQLRLNHRPPHQRGSAGSPSVYFVSWFMKRTGDFTFWISLSLSLSPRPNFRLRPNLIQKVKWHLWFGLSQSLSENFRWAFCWVRTLDSAIRSAKVNLNNSVLVQFTLHAVDSLIP